MTDGIWEYKSKIYIECKEGRVLDPLRWDNNLTLSCIGNETWAVTGYVGPKGPQPNWLPTVCQGKMVRLI